MPAHTCTPQCAPIYLGTYVSDNHSVADDVPRTCHTGVLPLTSRRACTSLIQGLNSTGKKVTAAGQNRGSLHAAPGLRGLWGDLASRWQLAYVIITASACHCYCRLNTGMRIMSLVRSECSIAGTMVHPCILAQQHSKMAGSECQGFDSCSCTHLNGSHPTHAFACEQGEAHVCLVLLV